MKRTEQFKRIAELHRWAIEELVVDARMTEANKIANRGYDASVQWLGQKYVGLSEGTVDAAVYRRKLKHAMKMFPSLRLMAEYLIDTHGDLATVLQTLSYIILVQRHRRKTLCLEG